MVTAATSPVHVFLISFPGQGHVNPLLRLGKLLASKGLLVTLSAPEIVGKQMQKANNNITDEPVAVGDGFIRFEFFEEGLEEDDPIRKDLEAYMNLLEIHGKKVIPEMIKRNAEKGRPISWIINNPFIPWVSDVAESVGIPSAILWVQSCASFSCYYHFHHNLANFPTEENPEIDVHLPCMPVLKHDEIPSFLHPSTPYPFLRTAILGQFKNLEKPFCILMETFQELENDLIDYTSKIIPIKPIGPLFKITKSINSDVHGDFLKADDCMGWLDGKENSSVIYISFGSIVTLKQDQWDEIAYGLLNSGKSFLWVLRPSPSEPVSLPEGFLEEAGERGKVVNWAPQERVLTHPSIACFVTHCGWNSTLETLSAAVPVVTFPQWGDQVTDAKYLVDEFKVGVRMSRGQAENRLITRAEVEKCLLEATVGPKAEVLKKNALKWKEKAEAAVATGGSSDKNIQAFVDEIKARSGFGQ